MFRTVMAAAFTAATLAPAAAQSGSGGDPFMRGLMRGLQAHGHAAAPRQPTPRAGATPWMHGDGRGLTTPNGHVYRRGPGVTGGAFLGAPNGGFTVRSPIAGGGAFGRDSDGCIVVGDYVNC